MKKNKTIAVIILVIIVIATFLLLFRQKPKIISASNYSQNTITLKHLTTNIYPGKTIKITIKGNPANTYSIKVIYSSGESKAEGLYPKSPNKSGIVSWTWKVGTNTNTGEKKIVISSRTDTYIIPFNVKETPENMKYVWYPLFLVVGYLYYSFSFLQILIIIFSGYKYANLAKNIGALDTKIYAAFRRVIMLHVVLGAVVWYLMIAVATQSMRYGFIFGVCLAFLMSLKQIGPNKSNSDDFYNAYSKYLDMDKITRYTIANCAKMVCEGKLTEQDVVDAMSEAQNNSPPTAP